MTGGAARQLEGRPAWARPFQRRVPRVRPRVLIVGCGDIGLRVTRLLAHKFQLLGTVRRKERIPALRRTGIIPLTADLDRRQQLRRLAGIAHAVLHFLPPRDDGETDVRTRHLLAALSQGRRPLRLVYISTSGVYGDCAGAYVTEARPLHPTTARARRRAEAERQVRAWAPRNGVRACVLRVPGIYAADRLPLERLRAATPAIVADQDSHTNHIHADDLSRIVVAALRNGRANRVYNACDDSDMKMGDYFDAVADAFGLPRPARLPRAEVQARISPALWSFMNESRRLDNTRMRRELKVQLTYPTVADGLNAARAQAAQAGSPL